MAHESALADFDVDWIYGTVSCWLWMNSEYVAVGWCLNLDVSLLGVRRVMTQSQLHTRPLLKNTTTAMMAHGIRFHVHWSWCWLNILYEMKWSCVGFGRAASTLVLVHVWIRCVLRGILCTMTPCQLHTRLLFEHTTMAMAHDTQLCTDVD